MLASLAPNLITSGISALCKPSRFSAGKEYEEQLANHDIRRLIDESWSEAAAATVRRYLDIQSTASDTRPLRIDNPRPPAEFIKVLQGLKTDDFNPKSTVGSIRTAITAARRSLLPDSEHPEQEAQVSSLCSGLADSVVEALKGKYPQAPPPDFVQFLTGSDARFPGGILHQLCMYVALHLKNDSHAQIAVVHFTLQDISDSQKRISESQKRVEDLCLSIQQQNQAQWQLLEEYGSRIHELSRGIQTQIDQAFHNFVKPDLRAPFFTGSADTVRHDSKYEFTYGARRTPLVGREAALQALIDFLGAPGQRLWTVISGPAGSGKSRLAAELIAMASRNTANRNTSAEATIGQWRAGFLATKDWLKSEGLKWQPDADTLIVIDYAGDLDAESLANFLARNTTTSGCVVRIVLIDRLPAESDLGLVKKLTQFQHLLADVLANHWLPPGARAAKAVTDESGRYSSRDATAGEDQAALADALALGPVIEKDAIAIAHAWAGSERWNPEVEERLRQAMQREPELSRPLFAALLGHAVSQNMLPGELNPVTVAVTALAHQFRRDIGERRDQWEQAKDLFAVATVGQGIAENELSAHAEAILEEKLSPTRRRAVLINLRRMSGPGDSQIIPPLEPDFLGGLFVLQRILQSGAPVDKKASDIAAIAWKAGKPREFLVRLAADFFGRAAQVAMALADASVEGDHPKEQDVKKAMLGLLLSAVKPDALAKGGAVVLAMPVYYASKAGDLDSARKMLDTLAAITKDGDATARAKFAVALFCGALGLAEANQLDEAKKLVDKLKQLNSAYPNDIAVREWFTKALFNRTVDLAEVNELEKAGAVLDELRVLSNNHADDAAVREWFASALFNRANALAAAKQLEKAGAMLDELRVLSKSNMDDAQVRKWFAMALAARTVPLADAKQLEKAGAVLDELRVLSNNHADDAAVREWFTKALFNRANALAAAKQLEKAGAMLDELRALSNKHTDDVAVRECFASALFNRAIHLAEATQLEKAGAVLDELKALSNSHTDDAVVRERFAQALFNRAKHLAAANELEKAGAVLNELRALSNNHADDAAVRVEFAKALLDWANALAKANELEKAGAVLNELRVLSNNHADDAAVRDRFARALFNRANALAEANELEKAGAVLNELRVLSNSHADDAAVREWFAKALFNRTAHLAEAKQLEKAGAVLDELRLLSNNHVDDAAVRECFASALFNRTVDLAQANEPEKAGAVLDELRLLSNNHVDDAAVRERFASALFNRTVDLAAAKQLEKAGAVLDELRGLSNNHAKDAAVRVEFAQALGNRAVHLAEAKQLEQSGAVLDELRALSNSHTDDAAVRERFALALFNRTVHLADANELEKSDAVLHELRVLSNSYADDAAVRERFASALFNQTVDLAEANEPQKAGAVLDELRVLSNNHTDDTAVREWFASALFNRTVDLAEVNELEKSGAGLDELRGLSNSHADDVAVRELLVTVLLVRSLNYAVDGQIAAALTFIDEVRELWKQYQEPAVCRILKKALEFLSNELKEGPYSEQARQFADEASRLPCKSA
jgi:hypothetical protein